MFRNVFAHKLQITFIITVVSAVDMPQGCESTQCSLVLFVPFTLPDFCAFTTALCTKPSRLLCLRPELFPVVAATAVFVFWGAAFTSGGCSSELLPFFGLVDGGSSFVLGTAIFVASFCDALVSLLSLQHYPLVCCLLILGFQQRRSAEHLVNSM